MGDHDHHNLKVQLKEEYHCLSALGVRSKDSAGKGRKAKVLEIACAVAVQ